MKPWLVLPLLLLLGTTTFADGTRVLRMATVAPEGTSWARELKSFAREISDATHGELTLKWYYGGIAGDEERIAERLEKGQMDGTASGGMICQRAAPSMLVLALPGVFQSRDEATDVVAKMWPQIKAEALASGSTIISTVGLGPDVLFTRQPVRNMTDLKKLRHWRWHLDDKGILMTREMGMQIVPTPLSEAARAYEEGRIDSFMTIPTAALAFQWATQARYLTDLRVGYLTACLLMPNRVFDKLPVAHQQIVRVAGSKLAVRLDEIGREMDDKLLGGLFVRQGLTHIPVSDSFRAEFFEAARAARERLGEKLVPTVLLDRVMRILADYRAEHSTANRTGPLRGAQGGSR